MALQTTLKSYIPLSCGIRLLGQLDAGKQQALTYIDNAEKVVRLVARTRYRKDSMGYELERFSTVVFSHRDNDSYAEALLDLIRQKKLGKVTKSPPTYNPNSCNTIRTYVWDIDYDRLTKFNVPESRKPRATHNWNR